MVPGTARIMTAIRDVPEVSFMGTCRTDIMSGTMMKPPPTPTYPEASPANRPMAAPMAASRQPIAGASKCARSMAAARSSTAARSFDFAPAALRSG